MASDRLKVLAIGAHPDDVEFTCAGTLALLAARGCSIVIATLTPGDCSGDLPSRATAGRRRREAQQSAAMLGAPYACLEFRDFNIFVNEQSLRRVAEFIRGVQPDLVFAPSPQDYCADHENTSALVRQACFCAAVPGYTTRPEASGAAACKRIPHLYYCDPIGGSDFLGRPVASSLLVNVSKVIETKQKMLECHESQREWLRSKYGIADFIEQMKAWSAARASPAGWAYAEGFRQHLAMPFPADDILGGLLGDLARRI